MFTFGCGTTGGDGSLMMCPRLRVALALSASPPANPSLVMSLYRSVIPGSSGSTHVCAHRTGSYRTRVCGREGVFS